MPNSWGHTLTRLSDEDLALASQQAERRAAWNREHGYDDDEQHYTSCTLGRVAHLDQAEYLFTYNYVTGRAGRVSFASKNICRMHAEKAAKKYGVDLDAVAEGERPKHASEEAFGQFFGSES